MAFIYDQKIKFRHCDPAGIVFYPRYFEMMNDTVEAFFERVAGLPFAEMHDDCGIPTAGIEAQFQAPSRLGDQLKITLTISRLGRSSLGFVYDAHCGAEQRFSAASTIVFIDAGKRPAPWPEAVRARIEDHMKGDA